MTQKVRSFALKSIKEGTTIGNLPEGNSSHRIYLALCSSYLPCVNLNLGGQSCSGETCFEQQVRSPSIQFPPNILSRMILYNSFESYFFKNKTRIPTDPYLKSQNTFLSILM